MLENWFELIEKKIKQYKKYNFKTEELKTIEKSLDSLEMMSELMDEICDNIVGWFYTNKDEFEEHKRNSVS